jgi:hypothetical protein
MVNRAVKYLKKNESFEEDDFVEEVFSEPNLVEKFKAKKKKFQKEQPDVELDRFEIAPKAIVPVQKKMKRVIKLDGNFSILIHGNGEGIEKGEAGGRHYYRIWFDQEK